MSPPATEEDMPARAPTSPSRGCGCSVGPCTVKVNRTDPSCPCVREISSASSASMVAGPCDCCRESPPPLLRVMLFSGIGAKSGLAVTEWAPGAGGERVVWLIDPPRVTRLRALSVRSGPRLEMLGRWPREPRSNVAGRPTPLLLEKKGEETPGPVAGVAAAGGVVIWMGWPGSPFGSNVWEWLRGPSRWPT